MREGEYVLVTKYSDGSPRDRWGIGFYSHKEEGRHYVQGTSIPFRRVKKISHEEGRYILANKQVIEILGDNLYTILNRMRKEETEDEM